MMVVDLIISLIISQNHLVGIDQVVFWFDGFIDVNLKMPKSPNVIV